MADYSDMIVFDSKGDIEAGTVRHNLPFANGLIDHPLSIPEDGFSLGPPLSPIQERSLRKTGHPFDLDTGLANLAFRVASRPTTTLTSLVLETERPPFDHKRAIMASSEVDTKFLGQFARNIESDHPLLARSLFQLLGNLKQLSEKVIRARKLRRLDTTRDTKSVDLYCRIIWYSREGLKILEEDILPMVQNFGELKVLSYKLRASYYHLYVLFHNNPPISLKSAQIHTPPGLKSPRVKKDKGKGIDRGSPEDPFFRPSSVQPTHPLEGGPVGGSRSTLQEPVEFAANFLVPAADFRPIALRCFQEASALSERLLWGSHPLRLSVKVEFAAFLYDCLHERDRSRQLAKTTIAEVYNAQEGMDDDMFEDAAQLVGIMGKMMKRGTGGARSGSTPGGGSAGTPAVGGNITPPRKGQQPSAFGVPSPGMDNAI